MSAINRGRPEGRPIEELMPTQSRRNQVQLLTLEEVCDLLRISRSSVERAIRSDPAFPQPRKLPGGRLIRFVHAEVMSYINGLERVEYLDHAFDPNISPSGEGE
jgi:predicted DNA-binding transcriptional regulator AlpA